MKKLIYILTFILFGCGSEKMIIKNNVEYPDVFVITKTTFEDNEIQFYYNFDIWNDFNYWKINIPYKKYLRKDFVTGDTVFIKPVLFDKKLKVWNIN